MCYLYNICIRRRLWQGCLWEEESGYQDSWDHFISSSKLTFLFLESPFYLSVLDGAWLKCVSPSPLPLHLYRWLGETPPHNMDLLRLVSLWGLFKQLTRIISDDKMFCLQSLDLWSTLSDPWVTYCWFWESSQDDTKWTYLFCQLC